MFTNHQTHPSRKHANRSLQHYIVSRLEDFEDAGEEDSLDEYTDEDVIESVCTALANTVLSNVQGQHALVVRLWACALVDTLKVFVHKWLFGR